MSETTATKNQHGGGLMVVGALFLLFVGYVIGWSMCESVYREHVLVLKEHIEWLKAHGQ